MASEPVEGRGQLVVVESERTVVPGVVEVLEDALRRARAGEIRAVGVVAHTRGLSDSTVFDLGEGTIASLVLACERLKLRLLAVGEDG